MGWNYLFSLLFDTLPACSLGYSLCPAIASIFVHISVIPSLKDSAFILTVFVSLHPQWHSVNALHLVAGEEKLKGDLCCSLHLMGWQSSCVYTTTLWIRLRLLKSRLCSPLQSGVNGISLGPHSSLKPCCLFSKFLVWWRHRWKVIFIYRLTAIWNVVPPVEIGRIR